MLAWAAETASEAQLPIIGSKWAALRPEERWWLFSITVAEAGLPEDTQRGWRRALFCALSDGEKPPAGRKRSCPVETDLFSSLESARVPVRYMSRMLSAGNDDLVIKAYQKMIAVRLYKRAETVGDVTNEEATAALAKAGEPLADGGLSPNAGRDFRGPTAVLRSVSKPDLSLATNGTLVDQADSDPARLLPQADLVVLARPDLPREQVVRVGDQLVARGIGVGLRSSRASLSP